ncbi:hypothetical protein BJV78DRAFT_1281001 [Lactifluus subvellereus]|nr:hypothetical protein BJV78DRAFT_1281001 [Lactifluus subvellereus]
METFSWSDSLRALTSPCLSCLRSKSERNDLEDLLADSGSGTTAEAETLSLHSNPGVPRRKRARFGKSIRLFGWNLFGRAPIRLPDDEEEEEEQAAQVAQAGKRRRRRPPPPTISTSTLDSDAAPLDSAAIASRATRHAEEEAERAARRARRRERKNKKRAALALALEHAATLDGDAEFEGFPGSGGRCAPVPSPLAPGSEPGAGTAGADDDDDGDEEGDFGAGAYTRRTPGSSDSGRGSDSRSRTSTSLSLSSSGQQPVQSAVQPYNHHYISQQPAAHLAVLAPPPHAPARRKKSKSTRSSESASKTSSSKLSHSSHSASQSPSLASPVATQFSDGVAASSGELRPTQRPNDLGLHTVGIERLSSGFPSPGIGGPRNLKRDLGAFLANRGDS